MTQNSQDAERAINQMVNRVPVLTIQDGADAQEALRQRLCEDLAAQNFPAAEIAARYGLDGVAGLRAFLAANPELVVKTKQLRAARESDASVKDVVQTRALIALNDRLHLVGGMIGNSAVKPEEQIKAATLLSRIGGVDGGGVKDGKTAGPQGPQFNLVIQFAGREERISTTVVSPDEIAGPVAVEDDDTNRDEDV